METRLLQSGLHRFDHERHPRVLRLSVVHGDEGLVEEGGHGDPRFRCHLHHLRLAHPRTEERDLELGVVEVRVCVGDPANALAPYPDLLFQCGWIRAGREARLQEGEVIHLVLPHLIVRPGPGESHRLADGLQKIDADAGLGAQLPVGLRREPAEAIPGDGIEEREGEVSVSDGGPHPLERQPALLESVNEANLPEVPGGEARAGPTGRQDAEFHHLADVADRDPRPHCQLLAREPVHDLRMLAARCV